MNVVTQNIRMKADLVHAVQPVHEAQDLRPPSPLPRGLCQLSKNHMWGDAWNELNMSLWSAVTGPSGPNVMSVIAQGPPQKSTLPFHFRLHSELLSQVHASVVP